MNEEYKKIVAKVATIVAAFRKIQEISPGKGEYFSEEGKNIFRCYELINNTAAISNNAAELRDGLERTIVIMKKYPNHTYYGLELNAKDIQRIQEFINQLY